MNDSNREVVLSRELSRLSQELSQFISENSWSVNSSDPAIAGSRLPGSSRIGQNYLQLPDEIILKSCGNDIHKSFHDLRIYYINTLLRCESLEHLNGHPLLSYFQEAVFYCDLLCKLENHICQQITAIETSALKLENAINKIDDLIKDIDPHITNTESYLIQNNFAVIVEDILGLKLRAKSLDIALQWIRKELEAFKKVFDNSSFNQSVESKDIGICKICCDNPVDRVIENCKHAFCETCIDQLLTEYEPKCPFCQRDFTSSIRIYL